MRTDEITINWQTGNPSLIGRYFVAIKYGPGAGVYDVLMWDGTTWQPEFKGEVIAYAGIDVLIKAINIKWPDFDPEPEYKAKSDVDESSWKEV